jgi:hypothetical protein
MNERLEAHFENRIYYFYLTERKPNEIHIKMYNTPYIFITGEEGWINSPVNKMVMAQGLVNAVIEALGQ